MTWVKKAPSRSGHAVSLVVFILFYFVLFFALFFVFRPKLGMGVWSKREFRMLS